MKNDSFDDDFDKVFDNLTRNSGKFLKAGLAIWVFGLILGLAVTCLGIWALIEGIQWLDAHN